MIKRKDIKAQRTQRVSLSANHLKTNQLYVVFFAIFMYLITDLLGADLHDGEDGASDSQFIVYLILGELQLDHRTRS